MLLEIDNHIFNSIINYDQQIEKRHHPENFEPLNDIEVEEVPKKDLYKELES